MTNANGYIELGNPVSVQFQNTIPTTRPFMMKSLFSNNANVLYKKGSSSSGAGSSGVRNLGAKSRRT
jgi:hypothetical protein